MNRIILSALIFGFPFYLNAQGIKWETGLSWKQIKEKARQENKFIFVDCYATWCLPCKQMDKHIYPMPKVGDTYNRAFISIRVQANSTTEDPDHVKKWYDDAKKIIDEYRVVSYPTFLFLTPEGKLVHRASGGLNIDRFISLAENVKKGEGYIAQIEKFKKGQFEHLNLKELAMTAKYGGNDSLAKALATKYVEVTEVMELFNQDNLVFIFNFGEDDKEWAKTVCLPKLEKLSLDQLANVSTIRFLLYAARNDSLVSKATNRWLSRLTSNEILTGDTLHYLKAFMRYSSDRAFKILWKNGKRIDRIIGEKNWAQNDIDNIILKEEFYDPIYRPIFKLIKAGTKPTVLSEPDWKKLHSNITKKYGAACAKRLQYRPKMSWYNLVDNKSKYTGYIVKEMDRTKGWNLHGLSLNNSAVDVCWYSRNRREIVKAAYWMKRFFAKNPQELNSNAAAVDTYATLLYKAGRLQESLLLEERAVKIDPSDDEIATNLLKMKRGLPVWPDGFNLLN